MKLYLFALSAEMLPEDAGRILCRAADEAHAARYRAHPEMPGACQSLAAHVLLRYAGAKVQGIPMKQTSVAYLPSGQPVLPGSGLYCSVTHTEGLCLCAVADVPVGVDAEKIRPAPMRAAQRIFTDKEQTLLSQADEQDRDRIFFELWTRHESVVKLTGRGLRDIRAAVPDTIRTRLIRFRDDYAVSVSVFTELT